MTFSYFVFDLIGIHKGLGIIITATIALLLMIFKEVNIKDKDKKREYSYFSFSLYSLVISLFVGLSYSCVYLHPGSFLKGDLWKHTALAALIRSGGLQSYVLKSRYPPFFMYFLALTSEGFSLPLINFTIILALLIPAVSTLAVLGFFSAIEGGNGNRAKWATLIFFTLSGYGLLYLLIEYETLFPSHDLALTIMEKLGWGSGLVYSPSLGSFAHVLRLSRWPGLLPPCQH